MSKVIKVDSLNLLFSISTLRRPFAFKDGSVHPYVCYCTAWHPCHLTVNGDTNQRRTRGDEERTRRELRRRSSEKGKPMMKRLIPSFISTCPLSFRPKNIMYYSSEFKPCCIPPLAHTVHTRAFLLSSRSLAGFEQRCFHALKLGKHT